MSPRNQEKLYPRTYAAELQKIAEGDLATAKFLLDGLKLGKIRAENLFFLVQQSIEKSLKAVLCARGLRIPLVHDLGALVARLPEQDNPQFGYEITQLNEFSGSRRYQEGRVMLSIEEAEDVLQLADKIILWGAAVVASNPTIRQE